MKPFERDYVLKKINEYNELINENNINDFKIDKSITINQYIKGYMYEKEDNISVNIIRLLKANKELMRISPIEIESSYSFIKFAKGKVGVVGLGLGYVVNELLKKDNIKEVVVYEKEKEIIELYKRNFNNNNNNKLRIIYGDAYKVKKESFDFFYVDIYYYELSKKVVEDYKIFNKLHNIKEYFFWGYEHFLLSCRYEEIVWVYVPELWMEGSKLIFTALQEESLLNYYKKLDENLVSEILAEFKIIFDEED
ncbi:MAG: hypothetical protein GX889_10055 [Clostridiales bacterium]|nr:hypothetical protein [Clostridiales bacterium]